MKSSRLLVVGSLNIDLVVETSQIPRPGETVLGTNFAAIPGGKGNNQAVASSRLGADVTLIGCVGKDQYGMELIQNLEREKVDTNHITILPDVNTGVASITVKGEENFITFVPGANNYLTPEIIENKENIIKQSDIILIQLEIPLETVVKTVEIADKHGVPVIINPAPSREIPKEIIEKVTIFTPNEHELTKMFKNEEVGTPSPYDLLSLFPEKIVMTKGNQGAYFVKNGGELVHVPSHEVKVVDTTGAGDSFNAGLAVKISQGKSLAEAIGFAVAVGALSVTEFGAQGGMPTEDRKSVV